MSRDPIGRNPDSRDGDSPRHFDDGAPASAAKHTGQRITPLSGGTESFRSALPAGQRGKPAPLPKRPKGRLLLGTFAAIALVAFGVWIWNSYLRSAAYGTVTGRVIAVSPPWDGIIQSFHVREGDEVDQGQVLVILEDLQLQQRMEKISDELHLAQASLEAEMSQLKWQVESRDDQDQKTQAEYYEARGNLLQEQMKLGDLQSQFNRVRAANQKYSRAVSGAELDALQYEIASQQAKIEKQQLVVEELKKRVSVSHRGRDDDTRRLKPQLARIEMLQADLIRLRTLVEQGHIRSPVNGRIVKIRRFVGELAPTTQPVIEIVEHGSIQAAVYLPQGHSESLEVGQEVKIRIKPQGQTLSFKVIHLGERYETAPSNLERYYQKNERLLPVYLEPQKALGESARMRLGSEVILVQ